MYESKSFSTAHEQNVEQLEQCDKQLTNHMMPFQSLQPDKNALSLRRCVRLIIRYAHGEKQLSCSDVRSGAAGEAEPHGKNKIYNKQIN